MAGPEWPQRTAVAPEDHWNCPGDGWGGRAHGGGSWEGQRWTTPGGALQAGRTGLCTAGTWRGGEQQRSGMTPRLHRTGVCGRTGSSGRGSTWPIPGGSGAEAKGPGARRVVCSSWSSHLLVWDRKSPKCHSVLTDQVNASIPVAAPPTSANTLPSLYD